MKNILQNLEGGDRRSIGKVEEVVKAVLEKPFLFKEIIKGMSHDHPVVRMRAADAVEKITIKHPEYLKRYKKKLINQVAQIEQQEIRWHMAQIFPRLDLNHTEQKMVIGILQNYLNDESNIVKVFSLQALADFAMENSDLKERVIKLLEGFAMTGSPAVKNRANKMLKKLRNITSA